MTNFNDNLSAGFLCNESAATFALAEELVPTSLPVASGAPATGVGIFGGARYADNTNKFAGGSSVSELDLHTGGLSYTIAFWTKLNATSGTRYPIQKWQGGGSGNEWLFSYAGGGAKTVSFLIKDSGGTNRTAVSVNTIPAAAVWHMVVGGYDAGTGVGFVSVDGEARQEVSLAGNTPNVPVTKNDIVVGTLSTVTSDWEGYFDNIFLWKGKALSSAEIAEYYNSGAGTAYPFPGPIEVGVAPGALCFSDQRPLFGRSLVVSDHLWAEHRTSGEAAYTIIYREESV